TQSALLEVMQEHRVTVDGTAHPVPRPFLVIGTQNPIDMDGTYPLPEAQLDRFLMRIAVDYPDHESEVEVLDGMAQSRRVVGLRGGLCPSCYAGPISVERSLRRGPPRRGEHRYPSRARRLRPSC